MPIVIGKRRKQSKKFDVIARMIEETGKAVAGYKTAKKEAATAAEKKKRDEQDREFELMARQLGYDMDLLKYNQMLDAAARAPYERAEAERQKAREYRDQKMAEMRTALDRMHGRRIQEAGLDIDRMRAANTGGNRKIPLTEMDPKEVMTLLSASFSEARNRPIDPADPKSEVIGEITADKMRYVTDEIRRKIGTDISIPEWNHLYRIIGENWTTLGGQGNPPNLVGALLFDEDEDTAKLDETYKGLIDYSGGNNSQSWEMSPFIKRP